MYMLKEVKGIAEELGILRNRNADLQIKHDLVSTHDRPTCTLLTCGRVAFIIMLLLKLMVLYPQLTQHCTTIEVAHNALLNKISAIRNDRKMSFSHFEKQIYTWRHELNMKEKHFKKAFAQLMQPRELDATRNQIAEELSASIGERSRASVPLRVRYSDFCNDAIHDLPALCKMREIEFAKQTGGTESMRLTHSKELVAIQSELNLVESNLRAKSRQYDCLFDKYSTLLHNKSSNNISASLLHQQVVLTSGDAEIAAGSAVKTEARVKQELSSLRDRFEDFNSDNLCLDELLEQAEAANEQIRVQLQQEQLKNRFCIDVAERKRAEMEKAFAVEREEIDKKENAVLAELDSHRTSLLNVKERYGVKLLDTEECTRGAYRSAEASKIDSESKLVALRFELEACQADLQKAASEIQGLRVAIAAWKSGSGCVPQDLRRELEKDKTVCYALHPFSLHFSRDYRLKYFSGVYMLKTLTGEGPELCRLNGMLEKERGNVFEMKNLNIVRDRENQQLKLELRTTKVLNARIMTMASSLCENEKDTILNSSKKTVAANAEHHRKSVRKMKHKLLEHQQKLSSSLLNEANQQKSNSCKAAGEICLKETSMKYFHEEFSALKARQSSYRDSITVDTQKNVQI